MLKCIAIDDEPLALELLVDNIGKVPFLQLVAACDDPIKALQLLQTEEIVEMGFQQGFTMAHGNLDELLAKY